MKIFLTILIIACLLGFSMHCVLSGTRNKKLFILSQGVSKQDVRLDRTGTFTVIVDPPGKSWFRPGGLIEIHVSSNGTPVALTDIKLGSGTVMVTDSKGQKCLEDQLENAEVVESNRENYLRILGKLGEFDTTRGGPYQIIFEVKEPFRDLKGMQQTLVARHFICGNEVMIYYVQFVMSGLSALLSLPFMRLLFRQYRILASKKTNQGWGQPILF
jgi:hypothetical protein